MPQPCHAAFPAARPGRGGGGRETRHGPCLLGMHSSPGTGRRLRGPPGTDGVSWGLVGAQIKEGAAREGPAVMVSVLGGPRQAPGTPPGKGPAGQKAGLGSRAREGPFWGCPRGSQAPGARHPLVLRWRETQSRRGEEGAGWVSVLGRCSESAAAAEGGTWFFRL